MKRVNLTSSVLSRLLKTAWFAPVAIGVLYFVLQYSQIGSYGVTWDEPLHRNWGKLFVLFWKTGDRLALNLMPGNGIQYGPLYYASNYLFSEWVYRHGWLPFVAANHLLTIATASGVVGLTYVLGRMIGGTKTAVLAVLSLIFFPQFLAHSHYNPKDIPLMFAILLTSVLFVRAMKTARRRDIVLAAACMGFAVAAKVSAVMMAPVFALTYAAWLFTDARAASVRTLKTQLGIVLMCLGALVVTTYLFWPSAWGDLLLIPRAIRFFLGRSFWPGRVLFLGTEYAGADLPWYYTPFEFFAATPLFLLISMTVGTAAVALRCVRRSNLPMGVFLLAWAFFPIVLTTLPHLVRYDGIRQFFFVVPALCVLSAEGFLVLWKPLAKSSRGRVARLLVPSFVLVSLAGEVVALHPFEGSYRNEIVRMAYPEHMDRALQIEYWGATYSQGMDWLIEHATPDPVICVPTAGVLVTWYPWRPDFTFDCNNDADYVMFFTRYTEAKTYEDLKNPVFTISRMNAPLLLIYKLQ